MSKKSVNALRTIGEVATELAVEPHVLRFWESKFKEIKPQKRRGRRYYRPVDVKIASIVKSLLYTQGFTVKGAQRFLKQNAERIDKSTILELTDSMLLASETNASALASIEGDMQKESAAESALAEKQEIQPPLFDLGGDLGRKQTSSDGKTKKARQQFSDADKRRLKEIYRGLCYTKEELDRVSKK